MEPLLAVILCKDRSKGRLRLDLNGQVFDVTEEFIQRWLDRCQKSPRTYNEWQLSLPQLEQDAISAIVALQQTGQIREWLEPIPGVDIKEAREQMEKEAEVEGFEWKGR